MLSLPTRYSAQSQTQNVVKDWLLEIAYTDAVDGNGTLRLSGASRNVTNLYHGLVSDWGVIDESIDLANSQSSTADIQITVNNSWANVSGLLSAELFGGNKKFINQNVTIRSWIAGCDAVTDCLIMYVGRLVDIKHNLSSVTFTIEKRSPWDRIKIPNVRSVNSRNLVPSAYGDFSTNFGVIGTADATEANKLHDADGKFVSAMATQGTLVFNITDGTISEVAAFVDSGELTLEGDIFTSGELYLLPSFNTGVSLYPVPFDISSGGRRYFLTPLAESGAEDSTPHYLDENVNQLIPLADGSQNTSTINSENLSSFGIALTRAFSFRPNDVATTDPAEWTNPSYAFDGSIAATPAVGSGTSADGATLTQNIILTCPDIIGKFTSLYLLVRANVAINAISGAGAGAVTLSHTILGGGTIAQRLSTSGTGTTNAGDATTFQYYSLDVTAAYVANDYKLPSTMTLTFTAQSVGPGDSISGQSSIYDVYFSGTASLDFANEADASIKILSDINLAYMGTDGFAQGWTDGSGLASYPHDIYRDMLNRYAGWDAAESGAVAVNGALWTTTGTAGISIDTDRDWPCRWWTLSQKPLVEILRQLQFEGAFIWIFDFTSTISATEIEARVVYKKLTYSASDHTLDGNNLANIDVSMTPFSEIVTTRKANYQRHPADEKRYLAQNSKVNANLSNYNLDALENIVEYNLDFLTATADVDEHLTYYDSITGEPKVLVQADLLKPSDWTMQVGDSVQFQNMPYEPYGRTFESPIYFMCVRTVPSPTKFTAYFREVYEA